jgi:DNA-binding NarL/FixJ family response regulator
MSANYRILLNEDLPSDAYLVQRALKKQLGTFDIRICDNKEDFLDNLKTFTPHIILSDFSLPGFDWSAAFKISKANAPEIPFLIVSSSTNPIIIETCLKAGVSGFISKDELDKLVPIMMNLLSKPPDF